VTTPHVDPPPGEPGDGTPGPQPVPTGERAAPDPTWVGAVRQTVWRRAFGWLWRKVT
jgi:hypothetical protein